MTAPVRGEAVVVVPVHRPSPDDGEVRSLERCARILRDHDVVLLGPADLDYAPYRAVVPNLEILRFDPSFFIGNIANSRFRITPDFYRPFADYEFMLIHELDAAAFRDDLQAWCDREYDFVGAPWFANYAWDPTGGPRAVGNGGFSLRRVQAFLDVTEHRNCRDKPAGLWDRDQLRSRVVPKTLGQRLLAPLRPRVPFAQLVDRWSAHEDIFFGLEAPKYCPGFRICPPDVAVGFSFETCPDYCFAANGNRLPFGCHGRWNVRRFFELEPDDDKDHTGRWYRADLMTAIRGAMRT